MRDEKGTRKRGERGEEGRSNKQEQTRRRDGRDVRTSLQPSDKARRAAGQDAASNAVVAALSVS
jgi:hypothetical protein